MSQYSEIGFSLNAFVVYRKYLLIKQSPTEIQVKPSYQSYHVYLNSSFKNEMSFLITGVYIRTVTYPTPHIFSKHRTITMHIDLLQVSEYFSFDSRLMRQGSKVHNQKYFMFG